MQQVNTRTNKTKFQSNTKYFISLNENILKRGYEIQKIGIKLYDALHIASAEYGKAKIFLTTDDKLLKIAQRNRDKIHI